ncbi:hypothetical protein HMPREF9441_03506 [Paraprevotella clara YIT 11840]|uniref:Uncharacterized protein n=1 Tax=Paraprevotella clara YIT 11840 TaxID=762968 RepID=G5SVT9_9BACT|nr:hypothetical protein HMPREF9441_03506 [Paraprevotella clara YIT 11840]
MDKSNDLNGFLFYKNKSKYKKNKPSAIKSTGFTNIKAFVCHPF